MLFANLVCNDLQSAIYRLHLHRKYQLTICRQQSFMWLFLVCCVQPSIATFLLQEQWRACLPLAPSMVHQKAQTPRLLMRACNQACVTLLHSSFSYDVKCYAVKHAAGMHMLTVSSELPSHILTNTISCVRLQPWCFQVCAAYHQARCSLHELAG